MPRQPNVLFLLSDEHGFRHLSARPPAEGGEPVRTPTLDRLIGAGTWLRNAYCQMPLCTPSRMCLLAGREVEEVGAWTNESHLAADVPTLGSHFTAAGYATCLVGKLHFGGARQYAGFTDRPYGDFGGPCSHQVDPLVSPFANQPGMRRRTLEAGVSQVPESLLQERFVVNESVAWIREHAAARPDVPWLLNASFSRPHFPLTAPRRHLARYWPDRVPPPRVGRTGDSAQHPLTVGAVRGFMTDAIDHAEQQRARAAYFACVDTLDEILGELLATLDRDGLLDDTIIVYTTDHGEMAGEHGLWWKNTWHEGCTRVPFIISLPEQRRGELPARRLDVPVSLGDLFPTLCALTGIDPPPDLCGTDLSAALREGATPVRRRPVTCQALEPRWGPGTEFRMMVIDGLKYIAFGDAPDLLFDLAADPLEQHDLSRTHPRAAELRARVLEGFDFAAADARRRRDRAAQQRLPDRPRTPNQIVLGDGRLVECDAVLCDPQVVSENPRERYQ